MHKMAHISAQIARNETTTIYLQKNPDGAIMHQLCLNVNLIYSYDEAKC